MMNIITKIGGHLIEYIFLLGSAAVLIGVLISFLYIQVQKNGLRKVISEWISNIKSSSKFKWVLIYSVYLALVLCKTVLFRNFKANPLEHLMGNWTMFDDDGSVYVSNVENIMLFIPYTFLLLTAFKDKIFGKDRGGILRIIWVSFRYSLYFSVGIELCQLIFFLGECQLSDIVMNVAGGVVGGIIYVVFDRLFDKVRKEII